MKKRYLPIVIITGFLFLLLSSATTEEGKYYYAFKEKVPLFPKENTLLVKYADGVNNTEVEEFLKTEVPSGFKWKWHNSQTVEISTRSKEITNALRTKLESNNGVYTCQPFYTLKDGLDMGVTDEVLIRFLPGILEEQKTELIKAFDIEIVKTTKIYQKLRVKKGADALEIANKIYETGLVEFSTPNFISYLVFHQVIPNDTYFSRQITCNNTGQTFTDGHSGTNDADIDAPEAWEITTGCGNIIVAVIDQGVTSNHPDLPNSRQVRLNGSNFGVGDPNNPSPIGNENHGNACAGVIAATMNNNQGIAGIATNCKILPIRTDSTTMPSEMADAIEFAVNNGANILSNSWGYPSSDQNLHPVIVTAINYALNKNCVVIFSAGNTSRHYSCNDNGYVHFPANVNISGVITVGASDRYDNQADYSPTSSLIDVVAPSHKAYPSEAYEEAGYSCGGIDGETLEMWSIDIPSNTGYNPWPADGTHPPTTGEILPNTGTNNLAYTARFGGTSHSCPVVAGVAALMLSANPDLSYMDVFDILTSTANKVGGYTYSNGRCNEMGYGRVNAYAAVYTALPTISGTELLCSTGATYSVPDAPSGTYIYWNYDTTKITSYYGGNTWIALRSIGNGKGWVEASYIPFTGCDTIHLPRMTVWAGIPTAYNFYTEVNGDEVEYYETALICPNITSCLDAWTEVEEMSTTNYTWHLPSWYSGNGSFGSNGICFNPNGTIGSSITADVTNSCGTGYGVIQIYLGNNGCSRSYQYAISPNPASTLLTVDQLTAEEATGRSVLEPAEVYDLSDTKDSDDGSYTVEIWHEKKGKVKAVTSRKKEEIIDVSGLEKGYYILHIRTKSAIYKEHLLVK